MLKVYNFLTRKVEDFESIKAKSVGLYTCGPTVYDFAHIGNLRTYIFEDVLKRVLEKDGYKVIHVMNITDVDDKIIKGARERGLGDRIEDFSKIYERAFFEDLEKLNIKRADKCPKATEHIDEMIVLIQKLLDKGFAYKSDDGIYFSIEKFKSYGKLSGLDKKGIKIGARIAADEYEKDNPADFALWKFKRDGEPSWKAPFGEGRPGWHIECSAMSMKYLGDPSDPSIKLRPSALRLRLEEIDRFKTIDIHAGAVDLLFPHHENEIAQSEAATGKRFVNFWVEGEHLLVDGKKMAKSLGNLVTLKDIEKKGFEPLALRYLMLTSHYRTQLNFTWEALKAAQNALNNLRDHLSLSGRVGQVDKKASESFLKSLNDDLDTPKALSILWEVIRSNRSQEVKKGTVFEFDEILGLRLTQVQDKKLPPKAMLLIEKREEFRKKNNFVQADKVRSRLRKMGVEVEDTNKGPRWRLLD